MDDSSLIKIRPAGDKWGDWWEEKGRSKQIVRIFISHDEDIKSIQFQYAENGTLVLSDRQGSNEGNRYDVVTLNHPSEYITCISGHKSFYDSHLCSIMFGTNHGQYGPFGSFAERDEEFSFRLGDIFGGFHGSATNNRVTSIGVFVKPDLTLNNTLHKIATIRLQSC